MPLFVSALYFVCCALLVFLALFIYRKDPTSWLNRYFSLTALTLFAWLGTLYAFDRQTDSAILLELGRLNFASALVMVLPLYLFVREVTRRPAAWLGVLLGETLILAALTLFTPWIDQAERLQAGEHITVFGSLFFLYIAQVSLYPIAAIVTAFRAAAHASRELKSQLALIGIGILATAATALATNVLLPYAFHNFAYQDLGTLSTIFFILAIAYAITAHHLFDIRILIRRTIVFTLLLAFVLAVYSGVVLFLAQSLPYQGVTSTGRDILTIAAILIIAFSFDPLRRWLEQKTNLFLFRKEYEQQQVLAALASELTEVVASEEALPLILKALIDALHLKSAVVFVFEPGEQGELSVKKVHQLGYPATARLFVKELDSARACFEGQRAPIPLKSARTSASQVADQPNPPARQALLQKLFSLGFAIALPLHLGSTLSGLLLFGDKRSGDAFSERDLDLIAAVGTQTLSALQKARLYESDQSKTELVSIASHELLTPLAGAQGYLSMVLDEHLGKVDAQAEDYLTKASASIQRLSHLVRDLLSVSRLEAGRIKIVAQAVDIVSLIDAVVDQLAPVAKQKRLALRFKHPDVALPPVWADPDRVLEVLVNLISNAIKYTPEGSVTVAMSLVETGNTQQVQIEVSDTGIGIDTQAQAHLFEKFYRVATAQTAGIAGTGLGLFITRALVEKMGGRLLHRSAVGKGSTFSVRLPIATKAQAERSTSQRIAN